MADVRVSDGALAFFTGARLSHERFLALRRFPAFDGVRAIAAVMVIAFHFAGPHFAFVNGWLGVHMFFVLSGFLITTLLLREEHISGRISLANFWIRRIFRILPPYYLVLFATLAFIFAKGAEVRANVGSSVWWFLAVSPELSPHTMDFTPAWTIGIEQKFYIVWPLIGFVLFAGRSTRRAVAWVVTIAVVVILASAVSTYFVHFCVILFGCGMALAMNSARGARVLRFLSSRLAGLLAAAAVIVVQLAAGRIQVYFHSELQLILLYGLCVAAMLPSLSSGTGLGRALSLRPLRFIGDRSYSIYLAQVIASNILAVFIRFTGGGWFFLIELVVVFVIGDLMHRFVELPCIRFGKWLILRRAARAHDGSLAELVVGDQPEGGLPRGDT